MTPSSRLELGEHSWPQCIILKALGHLGPSRATLGDFGPSRLDSSQPDCQCSAVRKEKMFMEKTLAVGSGQQQLTAVGSSRQRSTPHAIVGVPPPPSRNTTKLGLTPGGRCLKTEMWPNTRGVVLQRPMQMLGNLGVNAA